MKVALIGDIHANLPALLAVMEQVHKGSCTETWNIGDAVGYGASPNEVVDYLREHQVVSIIGNYDRTTLNIKKKSCEWMAKRAPEKILAFQWAREHLSKTNRQWLEALPEEIRMQREGYQILLTHASPASLKEHLTPDTPQERLEELAKIAGANIVVCGHSHQPFWREAGGVTFINTGSVGRPDDGDARASYAVLDVEPGKFDVVHYRVEYDVNQAVEAIRRQDLPELFAVMTARGVDLDRARDVGHL